MIDIDSGLLNEFVNELYKLVDKQTDKNINKSNTEFYADGVVKSVSGDTATVALAFTTTDYIPNLTGKDLTKNTKVRVFYNKKTFSDAYIGVKF